MTDNLIRLLGVTQWPVMVLDDEIEIVKSITRDLRRHARVEAFSHPLEALKAFEKNEYSVVISDLKMPHLDGLAFLEKCVALRPNAQRILLTAFADLANLEPSINRAKLNRIMTKPWEARDLQEAVEMSQRNYEMLAENDELRRMALTDGLTGIANHRYFWERLESEFSRAKRYHRPLCLIMCDVDNFKRFNEEFGHQRGDEVLRTFAHFLDNSRRSMDTVARYGGEEFMVILPEASRSHAVDIAKRYLQGMKDQHEITASFGIAYFPDDAASPTDLVKAADRALLAAKAQGKARVLTALDVG